MDQSQYTDVAELFPVVDSVVVAKVLYGAEKTARGWFANFNDFAKKENHSFFNSRTRSDVGEAYNTQFSRDQQVEPYQVFSIGVEFVAPSMLQLGGNFTVGEDNYDVDEAAFAHWWRSVLPGECSLTFKVAQYARLEANALDFPPGYGIVGTGGVAYNNDSRLPAIGPLGVNACTQGIPELTNRFQFEKFLDVPKNGQIEAVVGLSEYARDYMKDIWGPGQFSVPDFTGNGEVRVYLPTRYFIRVSLLGVRYVQKRGEARK